jgi:hypothetical protein
MFKVGMPGTNRLFMACCTAFRCACGAVDPRRRQLIHLRQPLHDGRRGHPHAAADYGALLNHDDHALCAFVTGAFD